MTLGDLIQLVKRQARYGDIANTSDQITSDIIKYVNNRRYKFWRFWMWDWSVEAISITIAAGTSDYTLGSTIGALLVLDAGGDDYLKAITLKRYLQWVKRKDESRGAISRYVKLGRDSSGNLKVRFWRTPDAAGTVTGWGKKRLTAYAVADIATNTGLEFFSTETHDLLVTGVLADVLEQMGDKIGSSVKEAQWTQGLGQLVTEEENQADEELTAPPPDFYIWRQRHRGGTSVV